MAGENETGGLRDIKPTDEGTAVLQETVKEVVSLAMRFSDTPIAEKTKVKEPPIDSDVIAYLKEAFSTTPGKKTRGKVSLSNNPSGVTFEEGSVDGALRPALVIPNKDGTKERWILKGDPSGYFFAAPDDSRFFFEIGDKKKLFEYPVAQGYLSGWIVRGISNHTPYYNPPRIDPAMLAELQKTFSPPTAGVSFTKVNDKGHSYSLVIEKNGEKDIWYMDETLPADKDYPLRACLTSAKDSTLSFMVDKGSKAQDVLKRIEDIRSDAENEKNDSAQVTQFELPRENKRIGYLGLNGMLDKKNAEDFAGQTKLLYAMPELLTRCGYHMVCADDNHGVIELRDDPKKSIKNAIHKLYMNGVQDFYLNINAHGNTGETATYWSDSKGVVRCAELNSKDIRDIISDYPYCHFTINSASCHGGGLIAMMRDFKDPIANAAPGKVSVFVHTKEGMVNLEYYNSFLVEQLTKMADNAPDAPKTYGEAHRRADLATKRVKTDFGTIDPEYWKSMPGQPSKRTADSEVVDPMKDAINKALSGYIPALTINDGVHLQASLPKTTAGKSQERGLC